MRRGEIWWANLPDPFASEPGSRRPVLIVQANAFNRSAISTVLVIILTSNLSRARAPGNVLLERRHTGLPRDSVANISQIVTADRRFLTEHVATLQPRQMLSVDNGLRLILELD